MASNQEIRFSKRPNPDVTLDTFSYVDVPLPKAEELKDGELLVKLVFLSVDPYMRGRMNETKSYAAGWELDKAPTGGLVAEVHESKNEKFAKGDYVVGYLPWRLHQIVPEPVTKSLNKIPDALKPHASYFIGACGMPGLSALLPIEKIGEPKEGETAFISGAAGAVGSVAGQILKMKGLKVYGSAGTDEKVQLLKDLGFDGAFNYNTSDLNKCLTESVPEGIDIFFDNVGGPTLETVLNHMKKYGRVIMCGSISNYNKGGWQSAYGVRNLFNVTGKSLKIQGFIVSDWLSEFPSGTQRLVGWVSEGKLKVKETIVEGFENLPKAFLGLFTGDNQGKMVVKV